MTDAVEVLAEVRNHIGHLTLNRPAGLNALTLGMVRLLHRQLRGWEADPQIFAVVLHGHGEKAFCAGGDIRFLYESQLAGDTQHLAFFAEEYALDEYIHAYPKPLMALMNGFVLGGGMGLVQGARFRVITERVRMGMPETSIGYFPDVGASYFLSRLPGNLGLYLGVTGVQLSAADALYAGLADKLLDSTRLADFDQQLDNLDWSETDLEALLVRHADPSPPSANLQTLHPAIEEHFASRSLVAIRASLQAEQRPAFASWAKETLEIIDSRSPLAASVTLELLHRGRNLSLADCFRLELHLDQQWLAHGDFMEGVRALIIDKDKNPRWNPPTLTDVTLQRVEEFFAGF